MTTDSTSDSAPARDLATLTEMMMRGSAYREEYETEIFGGPAILVFKPIPDALYIPLLAQLRQSLDMEDEEIMEDFESRIDEADEPADIDVSDLDENAMEVLKTLCILGIDADKMESDEDALRKLIQGNPETGHVGLVGGFLLEWGFQAMNVTGNLMDAQKFRGGRNRE